MTMRWKGKPIDELSREELVAAVEELLQANIRRELVVLPYRTHDQMVRHVVQDGVLWSSPPGAAELGNSWETGQELGNREAGK